MFDATNVETVETTEVSTPEVETTVDSDSGTSEFMEGFLGTNETETEPEEEGASPETPADATAETNSDEGTIAYTYNHSTTQLPKSQVEGIAKAMNLKADDVVELLEKGSNYDTLSARQKPYWPLIMKVNDYAKDAGVDAATAIQKAIDALDVMSSDKYVRELRRQYPSANINMVTELARNRASQAREQRARQDAINRQQAAENERKDKWVSFFRNHTDVTAESLSDRMVQALENNEDPELVFAQEQNSILSKQNNELLQKQSNASRSPGSAKKTAGGKGSSDFMSGFWGK